MATESPIRITEASRKWVSRNEMAAFGTPSINMGMEDPGLVLKGQSGQPRKMTLAPNRSGSAPPSMEGSFAAIENLMFRHKMAATAGLASPNPAGAADMCECEEQLRADPSYFAYYCAHVNLNPRLPPPLISDENRHLFLGSTGSNRRLVSFDDSSNGSFRLTPSSLSTHKEESNNDRSPKQEDCSQAPSPVHNESHPYKHESVAEADNRHGDDIRQPPYSAPTTTTVSSTSLLDGRGGSVPIKPSVDRNSVSCLEDDVSSESRRIQRDRQQRSVFQAHGSHPQMVSQGQAYTGVHFLNRLSDFASELERGLQSSGFTQTPYASSAPYVMPENHVYANMIPSGYFSQQYTVGGYAFNPTPISPYVTGYLPTSPVPMPFDINLQHPNKFYGHLGLPVQPSLAQSFQLSGHGDDPIQKQPHLRMAGHANLNSRAVDTMSPYYLSNPTNLGALQFPPVSGSPMGGNRASFAGSRWQAQHPGFKDPKTYSFLEDLKSGKGRRFELSDISGHIVEFCADQHGSRFIQQKLEACSIEEKESVFNEVLPEASSLITDVFGNYVIQKFFEYGTAEHRRQLATRLEGQILPLSLQMYGCRVIQKALDAIEVEQKVKLVRELDGHVLRCVRDQNGNHVIQKCIESIPMEKIKFVISSFRGHVAALSTHPYGCRVIQRVLEHSTDELQSQFIVDEILESAYSLAQDQYGNYVTQHVLERGKPEERSEIVHKLAGRIVQLSQHKFASNVIEKCLEYGDSAARRIVVEEIVGVGDSSDNLLAMVKDQFANYVIQKVLQTCTGDQREMLLGRIKVHLNSLKKYTYGKHIVARFEQLYGEEIQASGL